MTVDELIELLREVQHNGQGQLPVVNAEDIQYSSVEVSDEPYLAVVLE
jgi:hypothetical protein